MKNLLLLLLLLSKFSFAESWGSELIKFNLEGGPREATMLWISGFSYSATAFYQRCGGLPKKDYVHSDYLIRQLNKKFTGKTISSEQATSVLDKILSERYPCEPI